MEYYSMSSKTLDSWDLIRFPVRTPNRVPHREKTSIDDINPHVYYSKGVRKKLSRRIEPLRNRKRIESSTSLILTKTRSRKIVNEYFVSSFTNIKPHNPVHGDFYDKCPGTDKKPLINVTVIPQGQQAETETTYNRKGNTRKPPSTRTNLENSFNTKNVFLVVTGRKKKKIYELNTSVAGETHFDKNVFRETFNAKMNKYKRKFTPKNDTSPFADDLSETCPHECNCAAAQKRNTREPSPNKNKLKNEAASPKKKTNAAEGFQISNKRRISNEAKTEINVTRPTTDVDAPKSRIRITGRLGLTRDDRYVLKCDATVDDKPISTQFQSADCSMFPLTMLAGDVRERCPVNRCFRPPPTKQRDAIIQADVRYFPCPAFEKVSQGTQVYFDAERQTPKLVANYDKIVGCCCANTAETSTYTSDDEDIALKKCKSPIVIISVYPNQESSKNITNNKVTTAEHLRQQFVPQPVGNLKLKQKHKMGSIIEDPNKKNKFAARSRPPSPLKSNNKEKDTVVKNHVYEKKVHETITPSGSKKTKMKSSKVQTIKQTNTTTPTTKKTEQKSKSQATSRSPSPSRRGNSPKPKPKTTAGTNTEQMLAKKALVDDFTKKYTEQLNEKKTKEGSAFKTKHNVSNVSINIEGDSDCYNVSFSQGDLDTDLTVRKNNRGNMPKHPGDDDHSTSLENFLFMQPDNEPRKRSFSQTLMFDGTEPPTVKMNPKLNVRDSIEVSHRREDRASIVGKVTQTNSDKNAPKEVDTKFLAPMKHFQGDECSIMDPNERDREIRKLLGIDKGRFKPPAKKNLEACELYGFESDKVSVHCLYRGPSKNEAKKLSHKTNFNFIEDKTASWQYTEYTPEKKTSLHPDLDLNRHINMLLQLEQLNKKKPIVLTRRQYANVRKSLYNTLLLKNSMQKSSKLCTFKCSRVSIGHVRKKAKENFVYHFNKETQTDEIKVLCTINQTQFSKHHVELRMKFNDREEKKLTNEITKYGKDRSVEEIVKATESVTIRSVRETIKTKQGHSLTRVTKSEKLNDSIKEGHHETMVLFNASSSQKTSKTTSVKNEAPRKAASSLEIHNAASLAYQKRMRFSSSDLGRTSQRLKQSISHNLDQKDSHSIHTIFNGHRKSLTPNLGTSAYSLCPEDDSNRSAARFSVFKEPSNCDLKPRKPFLKRLISCLVMRVSKNLDTKFPPAVYRQPNVYSSIDSYHINTSLGAWEMSSSLYDTTASFYSNHTIQPIMKMKRGFFSSVRGFLHRRS